MRRRDIHPRTVPFLTALIFLVAFLPTPASAQLRANFRVEQINSGCWVDDQETFLEGDPDRYWRMAIFDANSSTIFNACAAGCTPDSSGSTLDGYTSDYCSTHTGCGIWNFTDRTISKVIPNQSGAYFYFGLWDDDVLDETDSLGDHWFWSAGPSSGTANNNNFSPYYADNPISSFCGEGVEGTGDANNFSVTYAVWFTDSSSPIGPSYLYHVDDGMNNTGWDNDTRFDLTWGAVSDPNSGIDVCTLALYDVSASSYVLQASVGTATSRTICPSGCYYTYTPVHGHQYRFRIVATNGDYPTLDYQSTVNSAWNYFRVDLVDPVTTITSPPGSSWQNSDFSVAISDTDSGSNVASCEWEVRSYGNITKSWSSRTCNASVVATVGPAGYCRDQGNNVCHILARSTDLARRTSAWYSRYLSIDWTGDPIDSIAAYTAWDGSPIPEGSWTQDRDPYFEWSATQLSPFVGYSWNLNVDPDCTADTPGGMTQSLQLSADTLSDGAHTFRVRAIDEAGNCGPVASYAVGVDGTPDTVPNLRGSDDWGDIFDGVWQRETHVYMLWDLASSTSPIEGYSYSTTGAPDCVPDTTNTGVELIGLEQGITTFGVLAVDSAENCGPADEFDIAVDSVSDLVPNLRATGAGGDIFDGVWQQEVDVDMLWDPASSTSPIEGYSYSTTGSPDCTPDTGATTVLLTGLAQGITTFRVSAIDSAENCGPVNEFDLAVDNVGDPIASMELYDYAGGLLIDEATWQADNDPYVTWPVPASDSPIVAYSIDVNEVPDCAADTPDPEYQFDPDVLPNGVHVIQVRAIDDAGNCGDPATFEIWVNADAGTSPGDILGGLRVDKNDIDPENVDLSWTASCSGVAIDYSIHEGELGDWYTHEAKECSTGAALSMTIEPEPGDRYFLVVPVSWSEEGTYGNALPGGPRPVSVPACLALQAPAPHCP